MTPDHQSSERPRRAWLTPTELLLLVSAAIILVLAANSGNKIVLGLVALGAILVPALYYVFDLRRYRARRRQTEMAALGHLRMYLDSQKSAR